MRNLVLLASAAAMAAVIPSLADAQGRGKGRSSRSAQTDHSSPKHARDRVERDRDSGWVLVDGRRVRAAEHGRTAHPHGCPPGLANRNPPCVPPGQARRMFREGQAVPASYRDHLAYRDLLGRLPQAWRDDIPTGDYRYIYRDNVVYVVDPRTRLIRDIIDILD